MSASRAPLSLAAFGGLVQRADALEPERYTGEEPWGWRALQGRIIELTGVGGCATAVSMLLHEAQSLGENCVWIQSGQSNLFAPDLERLGLDLEALPVVRAINLETAGRALTHVLRSGAFGLVVWDLVEASTHTQLPTPLMTRLSGLAQHHGSTVVILTANGSNAPSIGALTGLRVCAERRRGEGGFVVSVRALRDKRRSPTWCVLTRCDGPPGLH